MRFIMIALIVLAPQAMAASLVTDSNGKVTGITELTLNNVNYDVTFTVGSPTAVYGANGSIFEGNSTGAENAVRSILAFLNEKSVGKTITGTNASMIHIPFDLAGGCSNASHTRSAQIGHRTDTNVWFEYGNFCDAPASDNGYAMARFAFSANQPLPVPTPAMPALGLLLLALGVISLGSLRSRKSRG